jgi:hypothetical protein
MSAVNFPKTVLLYKIKKSLLKKNKEIILTHNANNNMTSLSSKFIFSSIYYIILLYILDYLQNMSHTKKKYKCTRKHNGKSLKKGGTQPVVKVQSQMLNHQINKLDAILKKLCKYEVLIYSKGSINNIFYDEYGLTPKKCITYKSIIKQFFPKEEPVFEKPLTKEKDISYDLPTKVEEMITSESKSQEMTPEVHNKITETIPKLQEIKQQLPPRSEISPKLIPKYDVLVKIIKIILDKLLTLSKK